MFSHSTCCNRGKGSSFLLVLPAARHSSRTTSKERCPGEHRKRRKFPAVLCILPGMQPFLLATVTLRQFVQCVRVSFLQPAFHVHNAGMAGLQIDSGCYQAWTVTERTDATGSLTSKVFLPVIFTVVSFATT